MRTEGIKGHAMNSSYADRHLQPEEGAQEQNCKLVGRAGKQKLIQDDKYGSLWSPAGQLCAYVCHGT